jgi:hypothetical protein
MSNFEDKTYNDKNNSKTFTVKALDEVQAVTFSTIKENYSKALNLARRLKRNGSAHVVIVDPTGKQEQIGENNAGA